MSPPFFSRVGSFPFNEVVVNCGQSLARTNGNMAATNGYPACQQNGANKIQCHRKGCSSSFPEVRSLREHSKSCALAGAAGYRCIFLECTENIVAPNLHALATHQRVHQVWCCTVRSCVQTYATKDGALRHAINDHRSESPNDLIKTWWTSRRNKGGELPRQPGPWFDISEMIGDWEAESIGEDTKAPAPTKFDTSSSLSRGGVSECGDDSAPSEDPRGLSSAVFTHIASQLTTLSDLLDSRSLVLTAMEHRQLSQTLQIMQDKLRSKPLGSHQPCKNRYPGLPGAPVVNSVGRHDTFHNENLTVAVTAKTEASPAQPPPPPKQRRKKTSQEISPVKEEEDEDGLSDADIESDGESEIPTSMRRVDGEPAQHTHLPGPEQRTYFNEMQQCCVAAAFQFYKRYQDHLDNIKDRKQRQLCLTAKSGPIMKADDLSLPHWTHLLRRISDARGLQKHMVSRIESFNGDISPVDEVRHAFTKSKVKSDRDLLALLQLTRNFCWQLKDWDKCADLDTLYTVLEKRIRHAKKKNMEGFSKPARKGTFSGRKERPALPSPVGRQSATWPRMQEVEGGVC